ncbi:MAG: ester cyclase [Flavobacteriaceae bacterium]|nr:ester cyclase [Flavobacteriaceae bacterium]
MRKIILVSITTLIFIGCNQKLNEKCDLLVKENAQIEKNIKSYKTAWNAFFETRNSKALNTNSFNEQATVVTASGNITGIEAFRDYYNNYLTGFSDAEFTFIDVFGQGDKIVKHWNFKGTHDGEMFGIPATNKKVDISGTTLVLMKDGKVLKEQDYFDNHSFLMQLGLLE